MQAAVNCEPVLHILETCAHHGGITASSVSTPPTLLPQGVGWLWPLLLAFNILTSHGSVHLRHGESQSCLQWLRVRSQLGVRVPHS
jgi:hypothetical protein